MGVIVDDTPALGQAPRRLVVGDTVIECHEVYWADLNEDDTIADQVRFWFWALSMWNARRVTDRARFIPGNRKMRLPSSALRGALPFFERVIARLRLLGVCSIFIPILLVLTGIKLSLKFFRLADWLGPDDVYTLLRDVKLYAQESWKNPPPSQDRFEQPRVAIRRRMIQKLVEMGLQGYNRWYVFAHSLGSVVAWNGLMETEHSLPNYLNASIWSRCILPIQSGPNRGRCLVVSRMDAGETALMMPSRPSFVTNTNAVIDRRRLFNGLEGFFTYGSPLNKLAYLWPAIVSINRDEPVFTSGCQWINVYDPLDPVAGALKRGQMMAVRNWQPASMTRGKYTSIEPQDHAYHAHWILMINHLAYTRRRSGERNTLGEHLAGWLFKGGKFPAPRAGSRRWLTSARASLHDVIRLAQWLILLGLAVSAGVIMVFLFVELVFRYLDFEIFFGSEEKVRCLSEHRRVAMGDGWIEGFLSIMWRVIKSPFSAFYCIDSVFEPYWISALVSTGLCVVLGVTRPLYERFF